ncbi:outer membrane beta-barrel protein [Phenylobacterium aquaticum]|uniref:outer membrane beta-barrel protein n=1 Tax=Phenylobacterium aquaticum TaxID=1763816 RepID=UPI0026EA8028|nr:outer membrane beta-barrel protein [Phenylobacterium aquaticum]
MRAYLFSAAMSLAAILPLAAHAADQDWKVSVSATASAQTNDNIFAVATKQTSDTVLGFSPRVDLSHELENAKISAYLDGDFSRYSSNSTEDTADYGFGAAYHAKANGLTVDADASHALNTESRRAKNARRDATKRTEFKVDTYGGALGTDVAGGTLSGGLRYTNLNYQNVRSKTGAVILQDDRDHTVMDEHVAYSWGSNTSYSLSADFTQLNYDLTAPVARHNRDSKGYTLSAGVSQTFSKTVNGSASIGYTTRSFDEVKFSDVTDVSLSANLNWTPDSDTQVGLSASRSLQETVVPNSPVYIASSVGANLSRQVTDKVGVAAYVSYEWDDHQGVDRSDNVTGLGLSTSIAITKGLAVSVAYDYSKEDSSGAVKSAGYDNNLFSARLTAKF